MLVPPFRGIWTGWTTAANRNLMKFYKQKCQVLHLLRNYSMYLYTLAADELESSFAKNDLEVLVTRS